MICSSQDAPFNCASALVNAWLICGRASSNDWQAGDLAAARCGAKTRVGIACRSPAVARKSRCRMHGGAQGFGGPRGARNGNYKHGRYTAEAIAGSSVAQEDNSRGESAILTFEPTIEAGELRCCALKPHS
jgi:hypothetical protein